MILPPPRNARTTPRTAKSDRVRAVLDSLRRVVRELRLTARDAERIAGISSAQLFVLQSLATAPASSISELADRTMTDQSSVSVVVRRLVEKSLVVRRPSEQDSRRVELSLTARGRRLLERCPEPTQARLLASIRRLSRGELDALSDGMAALVREMGIEGEAPQMFFEDSRTSTRTTRADGTGTTPVRPRRKRAAAPSRRGRPDERSR
jgi:DNA-binding MarR family transcriptional regulator